MCDSRRCVNRGGAQAGQGVVDVAGGEHGDGARWEANGYGEAGVGVALKSSGKMLVLFGLAEEETNEERGNYGRKPNCEMETPEEHE